MKLDKRIIDGKKPLTCFDIEEAREFEGKEGYFCDYPRAFAYGDIPIEQCATEGILKLDESHDNCPYINKTTCANYPYFLPAAWLKPEEPEKKYRPFSLNEFIELYAIGDVVTYRIKDCEVIEQSMLIGFLSSGDEDAPGNSCVIIGNHKYGLKELFNNYELQYQAHWQPFGIEEE